MRPSSLLLLLALVAPSGRALASGSTGTDELLSDLERVPPTVIFVVDLSSDMASPCSASSATPCITETLDAIGQVIRHFDFAQYGVVGTAASGSDDSFYRIAPVGSSYAEIAAALSGVTVHGGSSRNFAEVLESLAEDYLKLSTPLDGTNNDGDSFTGDWNESPVAYSCSETHIVVLGRDRPVDDDQIDWAYSVVSISPDVVCDASGYAGSDVECLYDNVVTHLYNQDHNVTEAGTQRAVVHTIGLNLTSGGLAEDVYNNAASNTAGEGIYSNATTSTEVVSAVLSVMNEIQSGRYSRSTPVISADGAYLLYTFYDVVGDNPLAQGHVRAYAMENDPTSPYYGQILYEGPAEYGGAVWDGGDLLVSRPVDHAEYNPDDRNGIGHRDIYTWEYNAYLKMLTDGSDRRLSFDREFAQNVGTTTALDNYMDTSTSGTAAAATSPYNLTWRDSGDYYINEDDLQSLIDFVRGWPLAEFKYLDLARGAWKLGDSPYAIPLLVTGRSDIFTTDNTYRAFLEGLEADGVPSIVLLPANDGMLHAFRLEDDPTTTATDEAGQELWAWVPGYLLLRDKNAEWANDLIDLMWYGRTFLFDATPVVEDVWLDFDGDGTKAADGSEWRRVVVVQQGLGGPATLALDITDPMSPEYLWEQANGQQLDGESMDPAEDPTAMGYTLGRPVIFNVYDSPASGTPHDRWVAMWGGGQAPSFASSSSGVDYYASTEASLYMWNIGDGFYYNEGVGYSRTGDNIGTDMPDLSGNGGGETWTGLDYDGSDSAVERSYIASALTVVDVDADGDGDVAYFPVTSAYRPADESGGGPSDPEVPGSSWMYKAILDATDPDDLTWAQWYDPMDGSPGVSSAAIGDRPEVYYAATSAWLPDGRLGIYWGTGTPFSREGASDYGYFFAMYDANPLDPTSVAQPISCYTSSSTYNDGWLQLDLGEGLTADPIVYAGVVYFTTYTPDADRCEVGIGRVYGVRYDDCSPGLDTDSSGVADWSDDVAIQEDGYVSGVTVSSMGTVHYATATPDGGMDQSGAQTIEAATDPFLGTAAIAWMEMY